MSMETSAGWPGYVVVEGPIGSGKTTLAKRLADTMQADLLLERAEENPFLERYYQNPKLSALPTQLHFLFQRYRQLETLRQGDLFRSRIVVDFMMEKDRLFAETTLEPEELWLYDEVASKLDNKTNPPDLVIYLQAPVEVLMERIQRRDRPMERKLSRDYIAPLADAYTRFFYHFDDAPLLIVNASEIDLVHRDADYEELLGRIRTVHNGRHYFNPLPIAL